MSNLIEQTKFKKLISKKYCLTSWSGNIEEYVKNTSTHNNTTYENQILTNTSGGFYIETIESYKKSAYEERYFFELELPTEDPKFKIIKNNCNIILVNMAKIKESFDVCDISTIGQFNFQMTEDLIRVIALNDVVETLEYFKDSIQLIEDSANIIVLNCQQLKTLEWVNLNLDFDPEIMTDLIIDDALYQCNLDKLLWLKQKNINIMLTEHTHRGLEQVISKGRSDILNLYSKEELEKLNVVPLVRTAYENNQYNFIGWTLNNLTNLNCHYVNSSCTNYISDPIDLVISKYTKTTIVKYDFLEWLELHNIKINENTAKIIFSNIGKLGDSNYLNWLVRNRHENIFSYDLIDMSIKDAISVYNFSVLEWYKDKNTIFNNFFELLVTAVTNNNLDSLIWLDKNHKELFDITIKTMSAPIILQETNELEIMKICIWRDNVNLVDWFLKRKNQIGNSFTSSIIFHALKCGSIKILDYFCSSHYLENKIKECFCCLLIKQNINYFFIANKKFVGTLTWLKSHNFKFTNDQLVTILKNCDGHEEIYFEWIINYFDLNMTDCSTTAIKIQNILNKLSETFNTPNTPNTPNTCGTFTKLSKLAKNKYSEQIKFKTTNMLMF